MIPTFPMQIRESWDNPNFKILCGMGPRCWSMISRKGGMGGTGVFDISRKNLCHFMKPKFDKQYGEHTPCPPPPTESATDKYFYI